MTSISTAYTNIVTINKLLALFTYLENNKLVYSEPIQAITLLAKLLPQMEEIAQNYNTKASNTTLLISQTSFGP